MSELMMLVLAAGAYLGLCDVGNGLREVAVAIKAKPIVNIAQGDTFFHRDKEADNE
jgi:hypothetical protein